MLELMAWAIVVFGALGAYFQAKSNEGRALVLVAALILGGLMGVQSYELHTGISRMNSTFQSLTGGL